VNARELTASALLAAAALTAAANEPTRCSDGRVTVSAADPADVDAGCGGAAAALEFFAARGIVVTHPIDIAFVDVMPAIVAETPSVGCYIRSEDRIYVLAFERCRSLRMGHDIPVDRAVHRGLVAHEVAHRIVDENVAPRRLGTVAHEYIAYVVMYSSMPPDGRERLLGLIRGGGIESGTEAEAGINLTLYLLDPVLFGVLAYRHYMAQTDGPGLLARVMAGKAFLSDE